jgi:hypothetical protein
MKRSVDLPLTIRPVVGMADAYPAGHIDPLHKHERSQLCYALIGVMSVVTETSTFVLPPQRAIWLPAGTMHQVACRGPVTFNILYVDPDQPGQPDACRVFDASMLVRALVEEVLTFEHAYDETGREGRLVALLLDEIGRIPPIPL